MEAAIVTVGANETDTPSGVMLPTNQARLKH
jgi:hypothetical protein